MSAELVAFLRHRVATRFYDRPEVVDVIARRLRADSRDADAWDDDTRVTRRR